MKFRVKIALCMLGLLSLLFGAGGSLLISASFQTTLEREGESAYNAYQMVVGTLQIVGGVNGQTNYADLSHTLDQLSRQSGGAWASLRLHTADKTVYTFGSAGADSGPAEPGSCTLRYTANGRTLLLSGAIEAGAEPLYLDMTRDLSPLFETRRLQTRTYQRVFLLMAALCALLSYLLARVLTRPLEDLSRASRAIASGRLSSRARVRSEDEVGLLARDFNAMAQTLEDNISELRESMERQERFMGSFAHELKTPMTSIIGYADLIRDQSLDPDEQVEAANYIVSEGKRLENLSRKLLDLLVLKKGAVSLSPARPAGLLRELTDRLRPVYARQGIDLRCDCGEGACLLEPDLVKSLVLNLVDNARKALPQGGTIRILEEPLPDGCRISVRDNGGGIPPQALAHLTEAFYRVDKSRSREQGGVGLGLALCREIAALHSGSLRFESRVGGGTTVIAELRGGAV